MDKHQWWMAISAERLLDHCVMSHRSWAWFSLLCTARLYSEPPRRGPTYLLDVLLRRLLYGGNSLYSGINNRSLLPTDLALVQWPWAHIAGHWRNAYVTARLLRDQLFQIRYAIRRSYDTMGACHRAEKLIQVNILRDLCPGPYEQGIITTATTEWNDHLPLRTAFQIQINNSVDDLPILADMLEDGGCTHQRALDHLRDTTLTHTRGCWVLEHILSGRLTKARKLYRGT